MDRILLSLTDVFAKGPDYVLNFKKPVLLGLAVISSFFLFSIISLTSFDLSTDSFLEEENPAIVALDEFRRQFGGDDSVFIIYTPRDGNVFSSTSLSTVQQITDDLTNWEDLDRANYPDIDWEQLNHIRRVQSLANIRAVS